MCTSGKTGALPIAAVVVVGPCHLFCSSWRYGTPSISEKKVFKKKNYKPLPFISKLFYLLVLKDKLCF